jgi:hypothetical protein
MCQGEDTWIHSPRLRSVDGHTRADRHEAVGERRFGDR